MSSSTDILLCKNILAKVSVTNNTFHGIWFGSMIPAMDLPKREINGTSTDHCNGFSL
jgi:hypothetical protein